MGRCLGATAERSEGKEWVVCGKEETRKEEAEEVLREAEGMNNKAEVRQREREKERREVEECGGIQRKQRSTEGEEGWKVLMWRANKDVG